MKKNVLKWSFVCSYALFIICVCFSAYIFSKSRDEAKTVSIQESISDILMTERSKIGEKDLCIVEKDKDPLSTTSLIDDKYILLSNIKYDTHSIITDGYSKTSKEFDIRLYSQYDISIFDIDTHQKIAEVDGRKYIEDATSQHEGFLIWDANIQEDRFEIWLENLIGERYLSSYNISTGAPIEYEKGGVLETKENSILDKNEQYFEELKLLGNWLAKGNSLASINGLSYFRCNPVTNLPGTARVALPSQQLPVNNSQLYSRFPSLEQYKGMDDCMVEVYIHDYVPPEDILKLFLEEGKEIQYDGFTLRASCSIDGEDHDIFNSREFYKWIGLENE